MTPIRRPTFRLARVAGAGALLLVALPASADTVWLRSGQATNALERPNVKVEKVEGGIVHFRSIQSDRVTERPMEEVVRIAADGEPALTQAEDAFAAGKWEQAAAAYQKAIASSGKQWVKDRSAVRLVSAAEKSGKFPTAVSAWVTLLARDPATAAKYKPQVPAGTKPGTLTPAVTEVDRALTNAKLGEEQRQTLMAFQLELARANGDVKRAQSIGTRLTQENSPSGAAPPTVPGATGVARAGGGGGGGAAAPAQAGAGAALAVQMAYLALDQKQYDQAVKHIEGAAASITEPEQQVEALFALAEARAGLAKDDPAGLKDAALGYMRVVARAKSARVASPRLPEALLKTAAIQERLKAPQEALLLYNQVAEEFQGTDAATRAAQAADRLSKADPKSGKAAGPSASTSGS